jgi:cobalt-zinc-cadmium efflux system outer membrane protein
VAAAENARELAKSQRVRDVSVGVQVERYPVGAPATSYGLGVAFPLFLFYDFAGEIQAAEVSRHAALDALTKARAEAFAEISRARADVQAADDRLHRFEATLQPAAERIANAAEFAFQRGASSVIEVLDARRTVARAVALLVTGCNEPVSEGAEGGIVTRLTSFGLAS